MWRFVSKMVPSGWQAIIMFRALCVFVSALEPTKTTQQNSLEETEFHSHLIWHVVDVMKCLADNVLFMFSPHCLSSFPWKCTSWRWEIDELKTWINDTIERKKIYIVGNEKADRMLLRDFRRKRTFSSMESRSWPVIFVQILKGEFNSHWRWEVPPKLKISL